MDRGYIPQEFVALFGDAADRQVEKMFTAEFGAKMQRGGWRQCCRSFLLNVGILSIRIIPNVT